MSWSLLKSPPYGARDAADSQSEGFELKKSIARGHTATAVVALEFPFFEYHLVVRFCYVWQIEVGLRHQQRCLWCIDLPLSVMIV
jgi:hypothetical protein